MTIGSRVLAIVFLLAGVAAHVSALSADELEWSITSAEEAAGAMAVDVDREGPGAVAVQLDVGRERGRSVIEVSFEQGDRDLALYLDPETGEILFSDLDDH